MKNQTLAHLAILLFALHFSLLALSAAVPLRWTVETSSANPATFDQFAGATYDLEAALQSRGKPLAVDGEAQLFWQTNGMGSAWWSAPATVSGNVLRATWTPACDVGAKAYNCFIGITGTVYNAAFQLRLRPSPGATPNALPLPTPVIDFAKVAVLNPPWSGGGGGGVNTNAVIDIVHKTVDGAARMLPRYLHSLDFADSYTDAAQEYYRSRGNGKADGGCSAVRDGGFLFRNFDFPFDERAEFVVKMSAGAGRFASVGVAQVGTNLTEAIVTSGKPSRWYKSLPGATVDGINEHGVVCEINVVDGDPQTSGWHTTGDIHPLAAIRHILDHATNAQHGATYIAANIRFPAGWSQNFHYMVADETSTYIVENGSAHAITNGVPALTNFRLYPTPSDGEGQERYVALTNGANITSQWWTLTYTGRGYRASDLPGITGEDLANLFNYWENNSRESHRGERFGDKVWWQSIHTSIYDITNRTLRVAVQETDDWYTFAVPSAGGVKPEAVKEIVRPMIGAAIEANEKTGEDDQIVRGSYDSDRDMWSISVGFAANSDSSSYAFYAKELDWDYWIYGDHPDTLDGYGIEDDVEEMFDARINPTNTAFSNSVISAAGDRLLTSEQSAELDVLPGKVDEAMSAANDANAWSAATYNFMTGGRTNCWFSGTNYVFGSDATTRTRFAWEDGMDAATVPCSMALWEIRDGDRQLVWDQRDWTAWYWSFKAAQMTADVQGRIDALGNAVTNDANYAWSKRYASDGTPNPDASTTFIDTPSVTLSPGMKWETVATVSGAAYWTIVGNGAVIGGTGTNAVLRIQDFEGNDIMTVTKGEHRLAWLERGEITGSMYDANGWVCFDMLADAEPVGYFSTTIYSSDFLQQTDTSCPAQYSWENIGGGKWRVHYLLKPGIQADACFAKFQVEVEGQTVIRYNAGQEISGGLIYNGVNIAPDISGTPAVGTVIQWKVVH